MKPIARKLLIALTSASTTGTLGWFFVLRPGALYRLEAFAQDVELQISDWRKDPNEEIGSGTEVCVRCGAVREVKEKRSGKRDFIAGSSEQQSWAEAHIGACKEHAWHETGCWLGRNSVACTMLADKHVLWSALENLDSEHADQMIRALRESAV